MVLLCRLCLILSIIINIKSIHANYNINLTTLKTPNFVLSRSQVLDSNNLNNLFTTRHYVNTNIKSKPKLFSLNKTHLPQQAVEFSNMLNLSNINNMNDIQQADFNTTDEDWENYQSLINVYESVKFWREIYLVFGSLITIVGFILNTLCIIIFYKSKLFRSSSFPYYVYVISVVDTLNIFFRFFVPQSIEYYVRRKLVSDYHVLSFNQDEYDNYTSMIASDYLCSLLTYFQNSLTLVSVWLMVAVSVERWLVIKFALQTKYMIKLRAFVILFVVFIVIFTFNIFDLSPGLYIKPQWFSNLTLLCERHDITSSINNSTDLYKNLGPFKFNTRTFALVRTIFQSILPFLVVLLFNSLIIYNFKKIKLTALGACRGKSNSCASVMPCGSNMFSNSSTFHKSRSGFKQTNRRFASNSKTFNDILDKKTNDCCENLESSKCKAPSSIIFANNSSSRSPSPLQLHHQKSSTPTSLVSALNLAERKNIVSSKTAPTTPTNENILDQKSNNSNSHSQNMFDNQKQTNNTNKLSVNGKQCASSSFLMPPTFSSQRSAADRHSINESTTPSIGTTNSSANLSLVTTSNLTTTTMLNTNQNNQTHLSLRNHNIHEKNRSNSVASCIESGKFSLLITNLNPNKKTVSTMTTITANSFNNHNLTKMSFKSSRSSKLKLNRETDIMLIVLSFCILLSQLPFTILWYLIYYYLILLEIDSNFTKANSPKFFYIIRMAEMCYFSLNFLFYITLSPSLRKELYSFSIKQKLIGFVNKYILKKDFNDKLKKRPIDNILNNMINEKNNINNNLGTPSIIRHDFLVNNLNNSFDGRRNTKKITINDDKKLYVKENNRVYSNSSSEFVDYLDKLRSISPIRRPDSLKPFEKPVKQNKNIDYGDDKKQSKNVFSKDFFKKLVTKKNNQEFSSDSTHLNKNKTYLRQPSNIKIVIDNHFDDDDELNKELKKDTDSLNDQSDGSKVGFHLSNSSGNHIHNLDESNNDQIDLNLTDNNSTSKNSQNGHLNNEKKFFNMSSPAFLTIDHKFKSNNLMNGDS